jgi:phospholipase C
MATKIKNVVMVCMENRSYHNIFGAFDDAENKENSSDISEVPPISYPHSMLAGQLGCSFKKCDGQLSTFGFKAAAMLTDWTSCNFQPCGSYDYLTTSFEIDSLPYLHKLYQEHRVCRQWYSALAGPTYPNKMFLYSGTSKDKSDNDAISSDIDSNDQQTILSLLEENGYDWRVYYGDSSDFRLFKHHKDTSKSTDGKFRDIETFFQDAATCVDSNDFPKFTVLEANYETVDNYIQNDFHAPGSTPKAGDEFVGRIYDAIHSNSALWDSTLLVVTFDEWGGFYDPCPPITIPAPEEKEETACGSCLSQDFTTSGFRVPTLLISKHMPHELDDTVYNHCTLPRLVIDLFELKGESMGDRVKFAPSIIL